MGTDTVRLMASIRPLASREEVMRAVAAGDYEALGRHYYALALKEGFSRFHLLGDEALDLAQEVALKIHTSLKAWRTGERKLPKSKFLTFWVMVEVDRAVREWFYRNRGVGYTNSRLVAKVTKAAKELQADLGREPTPEEIASRLEVPKEVVEEALAIAQAETILSLSRSVSNDDEGTPLEEFVGVDPWDRQREADHAFEALEEAIERYGLRKKLGGKEAELLERFLTGDELGEEEFSVLEEALRQAVVRQQAG